jgi:hypothetical protein
LNNSSVVCLSLKETYLLEKIMKKIVPVFVALILFMASCSTEDKEIIPEIPTKGTIEGSVNLYDEKTGPLDNSGMKVTVEGLTPKISTLTDEEGRYRLEEVPFGTYTLVFEKEGYGTYKRFNIKHAVSESSTFVLNAPSLGQKSSTKITKVEATVSGEDVTLSVTTETNSNISNPLYVRYFMSTSATVSSEDYMFDSETLWIAINPKEFTWSRSVLEERGFTSGQTVYVRVYGNSFWSNEYIDVDLNKKIFPNLNKNTVSAVSFVVP